MQIFASIVFLLSLSPAIPTQCGGVHKMKVTNFFLSISLFFPYLPITDGSLSAVVINTNLKQALAIGSIRNQIALFIYLPDSFLGRAIILQLENKHGISIKVLGTAQVEMKHWVNV